MRKKFKISLIVFLIFSLINTIVFSYFKNDNFDLLGSFKDTESLKYGIFIAFVIAFIPLISGKKE